VSSLLSTVQSLRDEERTALERALLPLARQALIGRLAGEAAHDAGNALFGLIGLVDLLQEGERLGAERIALLHGAARDLEAVLVPLLQLSRPPDGVRAGDLAAAAERAVELARRGSFSGRGPAPVACPQELVTQAVLHVLLAAPCEPEPVLELADGGLRITPAGEPSLDEALARRIAADHGGSLERSGDALLLRLR
jgi:signal transduction histidine kinase